MSSSSYSRPTQSNSSDSYSTVNKKFKKIDMSNNMMNSITNEDDTYDNTFSNFDHDYTRRAITNAEDEDDDEHEQADADQEELPFLDQIDSVKPVVDHQDRLWKQIDILDDVKKMSSDIIINGNFFNTQHSDLLKGLKDSQLKLLLNMKKLEKMIDESIYHDIWDLNIDETLDNEIELIKTKLFEKDQFTRINSSINEIKSGLDDLKANIKTVDESTKDMWDNNDFSIVD